MQTQDLALVERLVQEQEKSNAFLGSIVSQQGSILFEIRNMRLNMEKDALVKPNRPLISRIKDWFR